MIIYTNYKNNDWLEYKGGLPKGTIVVHDNETYSQDVVDHMETLGIESIYSVKLCETDVPVVGYYALDAENYHKDIKYTVDLGVTMCGNANILFPENLGGDKYENYDAFLAACNPEIVILERTYSCWWPWDLVKYWNRNKYLRDTGIKTYIGIWLESIPKPLQWLQWQAAKLISGNQVFYYSETATLPKWY